MRRKTLEGLLTNDLLRCQWFPASLETRIILCHETGVSRQIDLAMEAIWASFL